MTETGEAAESEEVAEPKPLQDAEVAYVLAAAAKRMTLDALVTAWRDHLHNYLQLTYSSPKIVHGVIDSMDDFLNHRSRK